MRSTDRKKVAHYQMEQGKEYFAWQNSGKEFAAKIVYHKFYKHIKPADVVIDFGCGGGQLLNIFNCRSKIGIEVNPVAREYASRYGIKCYESLEEVADASADVVISHHALEHVEFPIGVLREIRQKLKPGGLLLLCVPNDNWNHQKEYRSDDRNHHLHTWTAQLLGNSLYEAGFTDINIKARVHAWIKGWTVFLYGRFPLWFFNSCCYLYGIITGQGRELLATARAPYKEIK